MRIDSIKKLDQVYKSTSMKVNVQNVSKNQKDSIEISSFGRDLQVARKAVSEADDIRYDKVNEIKQRMQSGTYDVSSREVAEKMVDSLFDTLI